MIKKKKESASFGVIGLGRFGTALAIHWHRPVRK